LEVVEMRKLKDLARLLDTGIVAIVRAETGDEAARMAEACRAGGVSAIEITFTVPGAAAVLESVARRFKADDFIPGAGTVLDPETARIAILSGARFIVGPSLNPETARLCNRYQVPYMPGAGSVREVVEAMECGAEIVKIFPGESLGPAFVKAVKGPLPQAALMPTSGVSVENVGLWIKAGAAAVGVGGNLTASAKTGDYKTITELAGKFLAEIRRARAEP
jgi:2-dehydro-3-deoxyphosphogluconate aldolase/(4S)-4-hydroxy-2-oxoglutarate aldolase